MNPWMIVIDALGWGLLAILALLAALVLYALITAPFKTARTKRMIQDSRNRRTTVFAGKRD